MGEWKTFIHTQLSIQDKYTTVGVCLSVYVNVYYSPANPP